LEIVHHIDGPNVATSDTVFAAVLGDKAKLEIIGTRYREKRRLFPPTLGSKSDNLTQSRGPQRGPSEDGPHDVRAKKCACARCRHI
jgi:hypothetical protein